MNEKIRHLQQRLREEQLDALLLTRRDNVAWLTEGASFYVVDRAETGVASLLITAEGITLIAPENEMSRILAEEPLPFPLKTIAYPWFTTLNTVLASLPFSRTGSDIPLGNSRELTNIRTDLNAAECQRLIRLGREVATLVEKVARGVRPGMSEQQVEAQIYAECLPLAIRPVCTLVAADDRIAAFKHPVPGPAQVQQQMMITLGAERHGLNISITRMIHLGEPAADSRQRLHTVAEIHADMLAASRPERHWQTIFADIQASYSRYGFPDEWRAHHQGGPAGYGCRDFIVTPDTPGKLTINRALAWNPTLPGVKSEETVLLTAEGLHSLTHTGNWPTIALQRGDSVMRFADWLITRP
ncbi:Xaa-Pro peptidase family protein [Pantoea sp. BAV 3049]|uniref:M24 family metallopeptidase n=1 Tax=Pantoea sp. BAV 3049 TaxID=2654188 RepID=UPI00131BE40B|nr:M24 family metallopeptidase [Pantoea sp. BAV 3049]